ncbi:MAG: acetyl-CoA carboxylase biotin carboxylase subunit [Pseudomonadota bacterium]
MIKRLLIANRGEIAVRILRACRELNIEVVIAHSRVDDRQRYLALADDTVCVSARSYLEGAPFVAAAQSRGCDAIHPGYGFLSENAEFADLVTSAGLVFVGPTAEQLRLLGDKSAARQRLVETGVPVLPGTSFLADASEAVNAAEEIGYPVLLKAAYGGGGRGIRIVRESRQMATELEQAQAEARVGFGRDEMYLEKFLEAPRHIEVQLLGDGAGQVVHLGTRECSLQRRHQKVLEEAPAFGISDQQLEEVCNIAATAASALNYRNAGTFEFLYEDGAFYFIEANGRIQVEHPVTEEVTGVDLVKAQLQIASSGQLPFAQNDVVIKGHAIECRLNAETLDVETGHVSPSPGDVEVFELPAGIGVRVDTHVRAGEVIPHQYDSLIAKLIVKGRDRNECMARGQRALAELNIAGIATNLPLHQRIMTNEAFREGHVHTGFIEQLLIDWRRQRRSH